MGLKSIQNILLNSSISSNITEFISVCFLVHCWQTALGRSLSSSSTWASRNLRSYKRFPKARRGCESMDPIVSHHWSVFARTSLIIIKGAWESKSDICWLDSFDYVDRIDYWFCHSGRSALSPSSPLLSSSSKKSLRDLRSFLTLLSMRLGFDRLGRWKLRRIESFSKIVFGYVGTYCQGTDSMVGIFFFSKKTSAWGFTKRFPLTCFWLILLIRYDVTPVSQPSI
jgi:hypothetical protein